jgi:hypothetical protein
LILRSLGISSTAARLSLPSHHSTPVPHRPQVHSAAAPAPDPNDPDNSNDDGAVWLGRANSVDNVPNNPSTSLSAPAAAPDPNDPNDPFPSTGVSTSPIPSSPANQGLSHPSNSVRYSAAAGDVDKPLKKKKRKLTQREKGERLDGCIRCVMCF